MQMPLRAVEKAKKEKQGLYYYNNTKPPLQAPRLNFGQKIIM
jgi:hypothetical protein